MAVNATIDDLLTELRKLVELGQFKKTADDARASQVTQAAEKQRRGFTGRLWDNSRMGQSSERWKRFFYGDDYADDQDGDDGGRREKEKRDKKKRGGRAGRGGRGMGGRAGGGGLGGGAGLKAAGFLGIVAGFAQSLWEAKKVIEHYTEEQLHAAKKLAEVSGPMAAVMAKKEVKDLLRDIKKGDALAASTGRLVDAEARRKDAQQPIETAIDKLKNELLTFLNNRIADGADWATNKINEIGRSLGHGKDLLKKDDDPVDVGLNAAIAGPGGVLAKAEKEEDDAKAKLAGMRAKPWPAAAKPGRLP